jgi:hypothetical protein
MALQGPCFYGVLTPNNRVVFVKLKVAQLLEFSSPCVETGKYFERHLSLIQQKKGLL